MSFNKQDGTTRFMAPYTVVLGATNQSTLESDYAGLQCTSMALASLMHYERMGCTNHFVPYDVNRILKEGNALHTKLRDEFKLSTYVDGMIGISDLPYKKLLHVGEMFELNTDFKLAEDSTPLFLAGNKNSFLGNLSDFISSYRPGKPVGFLITIRCYTYSIMRLAYGAYALFDSHGHVKLQGQGMDGRAGFFVCPTLFCLLNLLLGAGMFGATEQCDIAPVTCQQKKIRRRVMSREERVPTLEEIDNPYVSMMAH